MAKGTCSIEGCGKQVDVRGWCRAHYRRWQRYGDPLGLPPRALVSVEDRFWPKVDKDGPAPGHRPDLGPCWIWTGAKHAGYGVIWIDGDNIGTHRVAYELIVGPIPDGLVIDHLCRNPPCCNPSHLEPVTTAVNNLRGIGVGAINAAKTHCPQGHPYDGENTYHEPGGEGRQCRTCIRERLRARYKLKSKGLGLPGERTHCPQGHPYDEENTYISPKGSRHCRTCKNERQQARRAALAS